MLFSRMRGLAKWVSRMCRQNITSSWRQMARRLNPRFSEYRTMSEKELRKTEIVRKSGVEPYRELGKGNQMDPRALRDKTIQSGARSDGWTDTHRPVNSRTKRGAKAECTMAKDVSLYGLPFKP